MGHNIPFISRCRAFHEELLVMNAAHKKNIAVMHSTADLLEATVKKCVFVEDRFKCLRESIFFGKSDSKRI